MPKCTHWILRLNNPTFGFILGVFSFLFSFSIQAQIQSRLSTGKWIKVAVSQSGMLKIDAAWLEKNQLNRTDINPKQVGLYSTKPGMLPQDLAKERPADLQAWPMYFEGETDGKWDATDYLLFWGESPHVLVGVPETHLYSDSTFYFIRLDDPAARRISEIDVKPGFSPALDYGYVQLHYEPETYNLIQSGREWLGDAFYGTSNKIVQYNLPDYKVGSPSYFRSRLLNSSINPGEFTLEFPGQSFPSLSIPAISGGRYDSKSNSKDFDTWLNPQIKDNVWNWTLRYTNTSGTGYLDYISLKYPKLFNASQENPWYLLPNTKDSSYSISIKNLTTNHQIWWKNGWNEWVKFKNPIASLKLDAMAGGQLLLVDPSKAQAPTYAGKLENSTWSANKNTEMVIICRSVILDIAKKYAAYKNLSIPTTIVTTEQIMNQFSGGKQDVTAIRNYLFTLYHWTDRKLKYALIWGDASIDYKGKSTVASSLEKLTYVPTYQSRESSQPLASYASDDYFGMLDSLGGDWTEGFEARQKTMEIAIGRIPVRNPTDAQVMVNKLIAYQEQQKSGAIRPFSMGFIADDGDANLHVQDAEDFSKTIDQSAAGFQVKKLYLDQFPQEVQNTQYSSQLAKKEVLSYFNEQVDFIHFVGHGSESGWTDEKILTNNDLVGLTNAQHLPILLTATCQFGRFDDPNILSGAELSLLSNKGGAIALISTTRPVFQSSNYLFGQAFYRNLLAHSTQKEYRLGDLFRDTKNESQSGVINRNISLLGDPSLSLPWVALSTFLKKDSLFIGSDQLNGGGVINGTANQVGNVEVQLYSQPVKKRTLGTKTPAFEYQVEGDLRWKFKTQIQQNAFAFPSKNLPNVPGKYMLKTFGTLSQGEKIQGAKSIQLVPTGLGNVDSSPPSIQIALSNAIDANVSNKNPQFVIRLSDNVGLMFSSGNAKAEMVINDTLKIGIAELVNMELDNTKQGQINYSLTGLKKGLYSLTVNCWDTNNNPAQATFKFQVVDDELAGPIWLVYPNPMEGVFQFKIEQPATWSTWKASLRLFNLLGQELYERDFPLSALAGNEMGFTWVWTEAEKKQINGLVFYEITLENDEKLNLGPFKGKIITPK